MIDTEIVVGSGMKLTVLARRARAEARHRRARGLDAHERAGAARRAPARRGRPAAPRGDGHGALAARVARRGGRRTRARSSCPGRLLVELVRLLPAGEVSIEHRADEGVVRIESGSASYRLHSYSVEDFPRLPDVEAVQLFTVDRDALLDTVARVSRSASRDESRPVLTGHPRPLRARQARDGGDRLVPALGEGDGARGRGAGARGDHPGARARASSRASRPAPTTVQLGVQENQVVFAVDGVALTTRRIDGQFPNYRQLLPEAFEHELALPRDELLDVVRRDGGDGAAQLAAAAALRRGRADRLGADAGRRRVARVAAGAVRRASRSRSASTPSSCATGSSRCPPTRSRSS